ncbi:MAG: 23S rRNA (uracil(1939)-C(5))-methyltransferase, partial [Xanthomonadales bacterium]|nr:23S rRNA (uracil(1939)-C(5))-methyltransferase [Xanthomonadales bacterium]
MGTAQSEHSAGQPAQPGVETASARCPHFGTCGGCTTQDWPHEKQLQVKQDLLRRALADHDGMKPQRWFAPLTGQLWNYRRKARLSVRYVFKKERVLVGFRERQGRYVADMAECHVLDSRIAKHLPELPGLIQALDAHRRIPQI